MTENKKPLRTPIVRIELPLVPSPPKGSKPYWWGLHKLGFYRDRDQDHWIWEQEIPEVEQSSQSASVRYDEHFGWLLVMVMTHDKAKQLLDSTKLPYLIESRVHTNTPKADK